MLPVGVQESSGTAPVSQINMALGCAIRKQAMDMSVVVTSAAVKLKRPISALWRTPQSKTYSRTDFGGCALCWGEGAVCAPSLDCAANRHVAAMAIAKNRIQLRFIITEPRSHWQIAVLDCELCGIVYRVGFNWQQPRRRYPSACRKHWHSRP